MSNEREEAELSPAARAFAGVVTLIVFVFIFALPLMLLWNDVFPKVFDGARDISYGQAVALLMVVWTFGRIWNLARKEDD